jgi:RHS repeat-associated protein
MQKTIIGEQAFGPYGERVGGTFSAWGCKPITGYPGHINEDLTGLIYMRGRYYSPLWYRFVNSDQGVDPLSLNQFAYVGGMPHMAADPWGMMMAHHRRPEMSGIFDEEMALWRAWLHGDFLTSTGWRSANTYWEAAWHAEWTLVDMLEASYWEWWLNAKYGGTGLHEGKDGKGGRGGISPDCKDFILRSQKVYADVRGMYLENQKYQEISSGNNGVEFGAWAVFSFWGFGSYQSLDRNWSTTIVNRTMSKGPKPSGTVAMIHTHNSPGFSDGDINASVKVKLPVYSISPHGIFRYNPSTNQSTLVAGPGWWEKNPCID